MNKTYRVSYTVISPFSGNDWYNEMYFTDSLVMKEFVRQLKNRKTIKKIWIMTTQEV